LGVEEIAEIEGTMTGTELATRSAVAFGGAGLDLARAVAPQLPWMMRIEEHPSWEMLAQLRVTIRAGAALNRFRVRDLLALKIGQVFESVSSATEDVPVKVGHVQLGWSEFEVLEQKMALRLTRLE
jgi:flagellar motor switch/type III secretory pathway protein FliN